jgi:hypothetical protein
MRSAALVELLSCVEHDAVHSIFLLNEACPAKYVGLGTDMRLSGAGRCRRRRKIVKVPA